MVKISAVYKITNNVTGEFYIGSSKNVKLRWAQHRSPSRWKNKPNSLLYKAMQEYGLNCFNFEILEEVETQYLKQVEQKFIDMLKPTYNDYNANGLDVERRKVACNKAQRRYSQTEKYKQVHHKASRKYNNKLCEFNGETLTLNALSKRFRRAGISQPTLEAKKYLTNNK